MLLGAISQRFDTIAEFSAFFRFCTFEPKFKYGKKVQIDRVLAKVELNLECGNIRKNKL